MIWNIMDEYGIRQNVCARLDKQIEEFKTDKAQLDEKVKEYNTILRAKEKLERDSIDTCLLYTSRCV